APLERLLPRPPDPLQRRIRRREHDLAMAIGRHYGWRIVGTLPQSHCQSILQRWRLTRTGLRDCDGRIYCPGDPLIALERVHSARSWLFSDRVPNQQFGTLREPSDLCYPTPRAV